MLYVLLVVDAKIINAGTQYKVVINTLVVGVVVKCCGHYIMSCRCESCRLVVSVSGSTPLPFCCPDCR